MKRGQPYLGAFLLKDENTDSDVITDVGSVHSVGVFAQITSVFTAGSGPGEGEGEGLTAVLYPHRRIRIKELVKAGGTTTTVAVESVEEGEVKTQTVVLPTAPEPTSEQLSKLHPGTSN